MDSVAAIQAPSRACQADQYPPPQISLLYDPIRDDPDIAPIIKASAERAHQEVSGGKYEHLGTCHLIWQRQKEILKAEHGITWYSHREMTPRVIFDRCLSSVRLLRPNLQLLEF